MSKIIRLRESGFFDGEQKLSEDKGSLEKDCLMVYCGKFESMDGPVEIKDEDIDQLAANHNGFFAKLKRLATGETHPKDNPPIQLDHSTSARDTVGRLVGEVRVGEHHPEGAEKPVKALLGRARILGKENVEKVEDGRWCHLSGGFDLENHKISELTITPFPAAGEAHMLSRERLAKEVIVHEEKYEGHEIVIWRQSTAFGSFLYPQVDGDLIKKGPNLTIEQAVKNCKSEIDKGAGKKLGSTKLTSGEDTMGYKELKEKMDLYGKCKKHLMEEKKLSEEDADKHLEAAKDDELTSMAASEDDRQKKLAADAEEEKKSELKRMSALGESRGKIVELSKGLRATGSKVQLAAKRAGIDSRLSKLQAEAKITPAERKSIDLDKLSADKDEIINATLSSYEKREPVIDVGMYGTTKALTAVQLKKKVTAMGAEVKELQTRLNMPSFRTAALARLAELGITEQDLGKDVQPQQVGADGAHEDVDLEAAYGTLKQLWAAGKEDEAKAHFKKHLGSGAAAPAQEVVGPDQHAQMSALVSDVNSMQSKFDEVLKLAAPALGIKPEDLV